MNPNPVAILALIGDLYAQISSLQQENAALKHQLSQVETPDAERSDG